MSMAANETAATMAEVRWVIVGLFLDVVVVGVVEVVVGAAMVLTFLSKRSIPRCYLTGDLCGETTPNSFFESQ